ncbi:hypothetical protein [Flavobacterium kingsejongi]|uniref:Uncharacterized protein n=1 Tax=Flavobacterium kingsejongi TaxID=1678728 RepID=A0A2S1LMJ0_9FLAO|nr:hypothetical protein [Flavobacterium kingsejongi]AWG24970.1 hypothetical protein FK004_06870 [Flavobacterium kingsejongi]
MKNTITIILLFILYSCNNTDYSEKEYYPSNNLMSLKEYNKKGELEKHTIYYDTLGDLPYIIYFKKLDYDSISYYYKNGQVYKTGNQDYKNRKFGIWDRYTREGYLSEKREYFIIKDDYLLNRQWYFSKNGDTLWYAGRFNRYEQKEFANDTLNSRNSSMIEISFYSKDTLKINEPFAASIICNSPLMREKNSQIIVILGEEKNNFAKNFSNEKRVKTDTFYNLNRDKQNRINFPNANFNYVVVFGRWFDTPGKKIIRGYMLEYFTDEPINKNDVRRGERRVYFEKEIYVKGIKT